MVCSCNAVPPSAMMRKWRAIPDGISKAAWDLQDVGGMDWPHITEWDCREVAASMRRQWVNA